MYFALAVDNICYTGLDTVVHVSSRRALILSTNYYLRSFLAIGATSFHLPLAIRQSTEVPCVTTLSDPAASTFDVRMMMIPVTRRGLETEKRRTRARFSASWPRAVPAVEIVGNESRCIVYNILNTYLGMERRASIPYLYPTP